MTADATIDVEADDTIRVLLVDDNEQWARFLGEDLERYEDRLDVTVALSANEAMVALTDGDDRSVDCVVADYRMPQIDGLQLLERIREEHSLLPFILVTGAGSEEVASTAIEAGVTDYLVKTPETDQTRLLARRINAAYEQYELQRRLEESEQRYRTVTEQTHDGVAIVQDGKLSFVNDRFATLVGADRDDLHGRPFLESFIAPSDQEAVEEILTNPRSIGDHRLIEATLLTQGDDRRSCELAWSAVSLNEAPAVLLSIRDVTPRKRREERLARERELTHAIFDVLVTSPTRDALETAVVETLATDEMLVWIGEPDEEAVVPRTNSGESGDLEFLTDLTADDLAGEPTVVAARTGTVQTVEDMDELLPAAWRDRALEAGYRSAIAVPIVHESVTYAVLAVYYERTGAPDSIERELLRGIGDTVAFAMHHVEAHRSLGGSGLAEIELVAEERAHYLQSILASAREQTGAGAVTIEGTHAGSDDRVIQYLSVGKLDGEVLAAAAREHPAVERIEPIAESSERYQLTLVEPPLEFQLTNHGAAVEPTTVTATEATIRCRLPRRDQIAAIVSKIEPDDGTITVASIAERERPQTDSLDHRLLDLSQLTEKQSAALEAAIHHGYFERPREASASDIAERLEITHSTYLQHLRAGQRKLLQQLYDSTVADPDAPSP